MNGVSAYLRTAIEGRRKEEIRKRLEEIQKENHERSEAALALMRAVEAGDEARVAEALALPLCEPAREENRALLTAVDRGDLAVVERLLKDKRSDPGADNDMALFKAARASNPAMVRLLLSDRRVRPESMRFRALDMAVHLKDLESVGLILAHFEAPGREELRRAAAARVLDRCDLRYGIADARVVELVKLALATPGICTLALRRAVGEAIAGGCRPGLVEAFLDAGADPRGDDNLALRWAVTSGHKALAARLLDDERVDPTANRLEAFLHAARVPDTDMLELLLAHVERTDRRVAACVTDEAARYGHVAVVDRLMDYELRRLWPFYRIQRGYIWLNCQAGEVRRNSDDVRRLYLADLDEALRLFREEVFPVRAEAAR